MASHLSLGRAQVSVACMHVIPKRTDMHGRYAFLASLAYRQTLAATKLVWNDNENIMWLMLKEISTNGDFQTMVGVWG